MTDKLPGSPYQEIDIGNGVMASWYIVPFDKDGKCTAPLTRANVVKAAGDAATSDVFVFSHGWNNDWQAATSRYDHFIHGYIQQRKDRGLPIPAGYKPLLVGIFWPSTALVLPWEKPPAIAAAGTSADSDRQRRDAEIAAETREIEELAAIVPPERRDRFYALARKEGPLTKAETQELAELMLPLYNGAELVDDDLHEARASTQMETKDVVELWGAAAMQQTRTDTTEVVLDDDGFPVTKGAAGAAAPVAAGITDFLDPRKIIRMLTVYQMKDRAGVVGRAGVGPLLRDILTAKAPATRVHLLGHSYGGKVVLSATRALDGATPKVNSMLLLQPAVNGWCFAANVDKRGFPGGYADVPSRVELPVMTTFSVHDFPLTKTFHLAVRRKEDLGELKAATAGRPKPPSDYAALGGYGPAGLSDAECQFVTLKRAGERYDFSIASRVIALNGDEAIAGHGDISVPATWWALHSQVAHNR